MRPPILFLTIAFGAGLFTGLDVFAVRGALYAGAAVLARGARRARWDGVGSGGPLERRRGPRRARGPPVGASRPDTARPRGRARRARDPERGTVRVAGADRGRAGVRAQRDPRPR